MTSVGGAPEGREEYDGDGNLIRWACGNCGQMTTVRHFLARGGVIVHDPDAAMREVAGLDDPEPHSGFDASNGPLMGRTDRRKP